MLTCNGFIIVIINKIITFLNLSVWTFNAININNIKIKCSLGPLIILYLEGVLKLKKCENASLGDLLNILEVINILG